MHDYARTPPPLPRHALDAVLAHGPAATVGIGAGDSVTAAAPPTQSQRKAPPAPMMRAAANERLGATPSARPPRRGLGRYAAAWGFAGLVATGYLSAILVGQEPVSNIAARWTAQERDANEVAAALARTQSEVAQLQRTVGALETDMGRVKTQAVQQDAREKDLTGRVNAVESRIERFATQLTQVFAKAPPPAKAPPVAVAQPRAAAQIETAAIPAKEAVPASRELAQARHSSGQPAGDAAQPAGPSAAILLARGPSVDALRLSWSLLNERHKGTLGALEPRVVQAEPGLYQLIAGPIASPADAAKVCVNLRARGVTCQAAEFKGEGL